MTRNIELLEEKIKVSKNIISLIENEIFNNHHLTSDMLDEIITKCESLKKSDF